MTDQIIIRQAAERHPDAATRQCPPQPAGNPSHDRIENTEIVHGEAGWFLVSQEEPGRWTEVAGPLPTREDVRLIQRRASQCQGRHEWVVYSTALQEGWLMLHCVECGAEGTIDAPSKKELSAAAYSPSRPYRWKDGTRVTARGLAAPRVIRAVGGCRCECPSQRTLPAIRGYERVPGGIWMHDDRLGEAEKAELNELAEFVAGTDLCSRLLPTFVRSCEAHTGRRHSKATHTLMDLIEEYDSAGLHCSPAALARIAREYAAWDARSHGM